MTVALQYVLGNMRYFILILIVFINGGIVDARSEQQVQTGIGLVKEIKSKGSVVRFQVPINIVKSDVDEKALKIQDSTITYFDWGVLMLPLNYSKQDKPVRLVIVCHGAGGTVTDSNSQIENFPLSKYLVSEGFAVMDMAGLPEQYAQDAEINPFNNMGSFIAVQSYIKGYHWVIENYNIKKDGVHLWGGSMGGLSSNNLFYHGGLPVLSQSAACPVTDLYNQAWLHPWSNQAPKIAIAKLFQFEDTGVYQPEKVIGFNPILNNSWLIGSLRYKLHRVPYKIWHADEDPVVAYQGSVDFVDAIKRAGGWAELRTLEAISHEPMDLGCTIKQIKYGDEMVNITPVVEEMVLWIKRFE